MGENFMNPGMPVPPSTGFEGLPYADNPLGQVGYTQIGEHMKASGFMPLGFSGQNIADQARNQKFMQMHSELLTRSALADRENYMRTIQGGFRAAGAEFGDKERASTVKMLDKALPYMGAIAGAAPDMLEYLGGPRGAQVNLAQKMVMGSRFRFDAATGRLGMGKESIESMIDVSSKSILQDDISHLRGFTAGQVGDMSQHLLSKGLLASGGVGADMAGLEGLATDTGGFGGGTNNRKRTALGRKLDDMGLANIDEMSQSQLREVSGDSEIREQMRSDPGAVKRMRKFDSKKVNKSIESYLDAASAMGEFLGTPNKGIGELMGKLEKMVGPAAMAQLSPQRIAGLVRQTGELARMTGVAPEMAQAVQQHAMNQSAAMGLQGFQGIQVAQHALGFAGAIRGRGLAPTWGQLSAGQATILDTQLTASATRSKAANRLGAFARMDEAMGGFQTEEAQLLMSQIKSGTLTDIPDRRKMMEILGAEGMDEAQISAFMSQGSSNQRLVQKFNIGSQVRNTQGGEVRKNMARAINSKMGSRLGEVVGLDAIPGMSEDIVNKLMDMTQDEVALGSGEINQIVIETLQESMGQEAFEEKFGKGTKGTVKARLFAEELVGGLEKSLKRDVNIGGARSLAAVRTMHDPELQAKANQIQAGAQVRGVVTAALQPLGRGNFMQRFIGALQGSETGDISDIINKTMGTSKKGVRETVVKAFEKLQGPMRELAKLEKAAELETNPAKRAAIIKEAKTKQKNLSDAATSIAKKLEIEGIDLGAQELSDEAKAEIEEEKKKKKEEEEALAAKDPKVEDKPVDGDKKSKAERESGGKGGTVVFPDKFEMSGELTVKQDKGKIKGDVQGKGGPGVKLP